MNCYDDSYTDLRITWRDIAVRVQSATPGEDLVLLASRLDAGGLLGLIALAGEGFMDETTGGQTP
ncbi:MAG: hypothetical protein N2204_01320 [Anaerolineae bacterium]|nr:hypothetical protein [Anaerolineae bacterium]